MKALFDTTSQGCSQLVTKTYSTSFSWGIRLFSPKVRAPIYAIYGFVRYADEIVDSFQGYDQEALFWEFERDYQLALDRRISMNPILNAFQEVVHQYGLYIYVLDFLLRMKKDLHKKNYNSREELEHYIYGSADVVGLMCLKVFVGKDSEKFDELKPYAMRLGSAFQKVNFLRDVKQDTEILGRYYFPEMEGGILEETHKDQIIEDIESDFEEAYKGIVKLPVESRFGVYLAYRYYLRLLHKLKNTSSKRVLEGRIRISNLHKFFIFTKAVLRYKLTFL